MSVMVGPSLPPCRDEGVPVHHDPVHGIVTNPGNREWGRVNWDPTISQVIDLLGPFQKGNASIHTAYNSLPGTRIYRTVEVHEYYYAVSGDACALRMHHWLRERHRQHGAL